MATDRFLSELEDIVRDLINLKSDQRTLDRWLADGDITQLQHDNFEQNKMNPRFAAASAAILALDRDAVDPVN